MARGIEKEERKGVSRFHKLVGVAEERRDADAARKEDNWGGKGLGQAEKSVRARNFDNIANFHAEKEGGECSVLFYPEIKSGAPGRGKAGIGAEWGLQFGRRIWQAEHEELAGFVGRKGGAAGRREAECADKAGFVGHSGYFVGNINLGHKITFRYAEPKSSFREDQKRKEELPQMRSTCGVPSCERRNETEKDGRSRK